MDGFELNIVLLTEYLQSYQQEQLGSSTNSTFQNEDYLMGSSQLSRSLIMDQLLEENTIQDFFSGKKVNMKTYLQSRAKEVEEVRLTLAQKLQRANFRPHIRVFQRLERYKRRRMMSRNIHLLPRHLRRAAQLENVLPARIQQRRRRKQRRRSFFWANWFQNDFSSPLQNWFQEKKNPKPCNNSITTNRKFSERFDKRLVTHVFHAKRMHMRSLWGYRLAVESHEKIFRVSYRFVRQHCTVHDSSYWICLQLTAPKDSLLQLFSTKFENSSLLFHSMYTGGAREGTMDLYAKSGECFGPVKFTWQQGITNNHSSLFLWLHPASIKKSFPYFESAILQTTIILIYRHDLARFELRGPHATTVLSKLNILGVADKKCSAEALNTWNQICYSIKHAGSLPSNMVIALEIIHPLANAAFHEQITPSSMKKNTEEYSRFLLQIPSNIAKSETIWTKRAVSNDVKMTQKMSYKELRNLKKVSHLQFIKQSTHSILLIQKPGLDSTGFGSGWDIICSNTIAASLLFKLAKTKNVLLLPLSDRNRVLETELNRPCFPMDYPQSSALAEYFSQLHIEGYPMQRKSKKPLLLKQSRLYDEEFQKQLQESNKRFTPMLQFFETNQKQLIPVHVDLLYGNMEQGATILVIEKLNAIHNNHQQRNPILYDNSNSSQQQVIGYITSSIYSLLRGRGFGLGFCTRPLNSTKVMSVWIYSPKSRHMFPAYCTFEK